MRWFRRWYGANPLHLLAMLGCVLLADYAAVRLLLVKPAGVLIWFVGAIVGHDVILFPLYVIADRSVMAVFRHRPPKLPTVPWINYLRVPVVLSGILLLMWFPLIFRIPSHFPRTTDLSLNPYLGNWLAVSGVLFLLSAVTFALRLRPRRRAREAAGHRRVTTDQLSPVPGSPPAPVSPSLLDPGPFDPGPFDPGPFDPGPFDPGPFDPGPFDPGPFDPGPLDRGLRDSGPLDRSPLTYPPQHGPAAWNRPAPPPGWGG